jgi:hypothetical protein
VYKRGSKPPPFLWEKGAPANFKIPKILTEFSFGIGMVNTEKIPKGSYRNTESVYNSTKNVHRTTHLRVCVDRKKKDTLFTRSNLTDCQTFLEKNQLDPIMEIGLF